MVEFLKIPIGNPKLARAQLQAFSKQVPLLYLILLVNTWALVYSHFAVAPRSLTVGFPVGISVICLVRLWQWVRTTSSAFSDDQAIRRLRSTIALASILGPAFVIWALSLYSYGDAYMQGHVCFYIGITVISCIFCLMHLRAAALVLTGLVAVPFAFFLLLSGKPTFMAIAVNMLLVCVAMVYVLVVYSRDFETMVNSKQALVVKHEELSRLSEENLRLAHSDSLTGLPNRRYFFAKLAEMLEAARGAGRRLAVGVVDLDGFKPINDVHGHGMGDRVLVEAGRRMLASARGRAFIARLGGDEFGLIFESDAADDAVQAFADSLCRDLGAPMQISGISMRVTASIGVATFPEAGLYADALFDRADYALYHAKQKQRGRAVVFSDSHETAILRQHLVEQQLRIADFEREIDLVFQPIMDVATDKTVGFEALARWHSPQLGLVSPDEFVKVAEHTDLITKLTCTMLRKALNCARAWPEHIALSINLSAVDLSSSEAVREISSLIAGGGIDPSRIDIEVTETAIIADYEQAIASLLALKGLGVKISLDDFGTGHSSLSQLHKLPIDKIKIDRSFIRDIQSNDQSFNIVKTVLVLSDTLGLPCVVEGVETIEQVAILHELHAQIMQGYLFSRPMSQDKALQFLCDRGEASLGPADEVAA